MRKGQLLESLLLEYTTEVLSTPKRTILLAKVWPYCSQQCTSATISLN